MLIDYYDINKKKLKSEVSELLSKSIYKYDTLDKVTISRVIDSILYNNTAIKCKIVPNDILNIKKTYDYNLFYTEYKAIVKYDEVNFGEIKDIIISQTTFTDINDDKRIKSRFSINLISDGIMKKKKKEMQ